MSHYDYYTDYNLTNRDDCLNYDDFKFIRGTVLYLHIVSFIFLSFLLAIIKNFGITFFTYALYFMWVFVPMEKMCWELYNETRFIK